MLLPPEDETRPKIVAEAMSWVGTPYKSGEMVKGKIGGGTDCAMLLVAVFDSLGLIPDFKDPRPYSPQWHLHRNEEEYMRIVLGHAKEVSAAKPGDVVLFQLGRLFAHGGIVVNWPHIVHAVGNSNVMLDDISKYRTGKRALWTVPRRFFTLWSD